MKARLQLALLRLNDPRIVRALMMGWTLALVLLATTGVVYADPCSDGGGCGGG